jgi:ribosomal protein S12 methylthiotransferase accessory factor
MTTRELARQAESVPATLEREAHARERYHGGDGPRQWVERLTRHRAAYGITRIGSLTRLDYVGVPVVQVTRPLALSNAVSLGKGTDIHVAAASGFMEAIETWAAERIPASAIEVGTAGGFGSKVPDLYDPWLWALSPTDWHSMELPWLAGWDLVSGTVIPVPLALVDTVYTYPPPHLPLFPRVTTGLGAGPSMAAAIIHAGLEILERDALVQSHRTPYYFERFQIDLGSIDRPVNLVVQKLRSAGLVVGAWSAPALHGLPTYRCHIMESERNVELAPMPAEGSACRFTHSKALEAALLEACQSRLAAISGAREDITRRMYPASHDRPALSEWRQQLSAPGTLCIPEMSNGDHDADATIDALVEAMCIGGARSVIVVPLHSNEDLHIHVVKVLAPPLRIWTGEHHEAK